MKDYTLLILAGGMGSRFGGLKQIEPVGPNGEFLIDYSIYDAIQAGFTKVVFVIKEETKEIFKDTIGKRIEGKIKVEYVVQTNKVDGIPKTRTKPLGTGHAIFVTKDAIKEPFLIINADDFYGKESYKLAIQKLKEGKEPFLITYHVQNTLSEHGSVKRGVCITTNSCLQEIKESKIEKEKDKLVAYPLNGEDSFEVQKTSEVAMNMIGFTPSIFPYLEIGMKEFLKSSNLDTEEFLIPDVLRNFVKEGKTVHTYLTNAKWLGMTYKEDLQELKNQVQNLIEQGIYPNPLWEK